MSASFVPNWIAVFNTLDKGSIIFNRGIFETNQISALYLDNFGDALIELGMYFGIFLLTLPFMLLSKIDKLIRSVAGKAYVTAFSFLMANMFGKVQSQILFAVVQLLKMNLLFDSYSFLSLFTAISTTSVLISIIALSFIKLRIIFGNHGLQKAGGSTRQTKGSTHTQLIWLQQQYEFLFGDFKDSNKNQFFFAYWITAFNVIYILLILCLQSVPILQCVSIVTLLLTFMIFSAKIKPFKKNAATFSHFFNFTCVLIAAILNLSLAFSHAVTITETIGKAIVSVIVINTGGNTLFSLGGMMIGIYNRIKLTRKTDKKNQNKTKLREMHLNPEVASNSYELKNISIQNEVFRQQNPLNRSELKNNESFLNLSIAQIREQR